jgi:hypothetical protein
MVAVALYRGIPAWLRVFSHRGGSNGHRGGEEALRELTDEQNRADDDLLGVGGVRQLTSHAEIEEEELGNGGVGSAGAGDKASSVGEARGTAVHAWCEGPGEPRRIGTSGALQEMSGRGCPIQEESKARGPQQCRLLG